jgi:hypothetical protein
MATDPKHGIAGAINDAGMEIEAPETADEGEQTELAFGADVPLFPELLEDGEFSSISRARVGPGRPKGARNKATKEIRDYILARHRDPLDALGEIISMPLMELKKLLGCDMIDALKMQMAAATSLAPYLHQKQPQAIQVDETSQGVLLVQFGRGHHTGETETNANGLGMTLINQQSENDVKSSTYNDAPEKVGQEGSDNEG